MSHKFIHQFTSLLFLVYTITSILRFFMCGGAGGDIACSYQRVQKGEGTTLVMGWGHTKLDLLPGEEEK